MNNEYESLKQEISDDLEKIPQKEKSDFEKNIFQKLNELNEKYFQCVRKSKLGIEDRFPCTLLYEFIEKGVQIIGKDNKLDKLIYNFEEKLKKLTSKGKKKVSQSEMHEVSGFAKEISEFLQIFVNKDIIESIFENLLNKKESFKSELFNEKFHFKKGIKLVYFTINV